MSGPSPTAERREEILGDLSEWLHAAADKTRRMLMESEEVDDVVRLNASLVKVARGARQCVLMHQRMESGRLKAEAEALADRADAEAEAHANAMDRQRARVRNAVERRFEAEWPETEDPDDGDEFNERLERLGDRLDDLSEAEDFLDADPDTLIANLCAEFGIAPPAPLLSPLIPVKTGIQADSPLNPPLNGSPPSRGRADGGVHSPNTS